jgi:FtsH-binding integral membrane protein
MEQVVRALAMGLAATVAIDLWATFANRVLGWPRTNWAMVGRWIGHLPSGQLMHVSIGSSPPVGNESLLGWGFHYLVGCIYALLYLVYINMAHAGRPTLMTAVAFSLTTIVAPWFLMQPALGLGICAARAPRPRLVRLQNVVIHTLFGVTLYYSYRILSAMGQ